MRKWIRAAAGTVLRPLASGGTGSARRVVVLLYHTVHPNQAGASATPEEFGVHLDWLGGHCDLIRLEDVLKTVGSGNTGRPAVAITFDDGFVDNYEHAFPELMKRGIPATFFVCTGLVNRNDAVIQRLSRLLQLEARDVRGLSWGQIDEMHSESMEIGAHTVTHPNLAILAAEKARQEITRCRQDLEDHLGSAVQAFAYPFGKPKHHFTHETERLVAECGFSRATSVHYRGVQAHDSSFRIPRFAVTGDDISELERKVLGQVDGVGVWQERSPRWVSHLVSPARSHRQEDSLMPEPGSVDRLR